MFDAISPKRQRLSLPSSCVVDGAQLRTVVAALKNCESVTVSFCPDTPLYLGDRELLDVTLDQAGQQSLAQMIGQPRAWLVVSFVDPDFTFTIMALPPTQAQQGVEASPLAVLAIDPAKMQPWLQHANTKVSIDPDFVILQSNEDPLAHYKLRQTAVTPTDWRDDVFQRMFPIKEVAEIGGIALRLPVHNFAAVLRSVAAVGDRVTVTLLKATGGPSVLLRLSYVDDAGSEVQAALRGVKAGNIYDLCGGMTPAVAVKADARSTQATSPLEVAMQAAEQVEAAADAAAVALEAAAAGERVVEFSFSSKLHGTLFGDKGKVAETQDAMLLHFSQNMLRAVVVTKSGLISVYAQGCLEAE